MDEGYVGKKRKFQFHLFLKAENARSTFYFPLEFSDFVALFLVQPINYSV